MFTRRDDFMAAKSNALLINKIVPFRKKVAYERALNKRYAIWRLLAWLRIESRRQ
jgi:hypothetical protein